MGVCVTNCKQSIETNHVSHTLRVLGVLTIQPKIQGLHPFHSSYGKVFFLVGTLPHLLASQRVHVCISPTSHVWKGGLLHSFTSHSVS